MEKPHKDNAKKNINKINELEFRIFINIEKAIFCGRITLEKAVEIYCDFNCSF